MMETWNAQNEVSTQACAGTACELAALSPTEKRAWIGWEPTPRERMPDANELAQICIELEVARELRNTSPLPSAIETRQLSPIVRTQRRKASFGRGWIINRR